jgi:hypothetical protein
MSTKFYDPKAERALAGAMADKERAEAANTMVRAQLNRVAVDKARAELADEQARRATQRQGEQRQLKRAARAERWASVRAATRAFTERLRSLVPLLIGGIAMGAPILIGWNGQLITAREVLHLDALAWVFPVALEGGAWWLAYLVHRAIRACLPTGRLRAWTWVLALVAAAMNFWHGMAAYGPIGGTGLALASLLGIGLWELTASQFTNAATGRSAVDVRTMWLRRLRYPRLSWAAASLAAALGPDTDRDVAWRAAWLDRYGVGLDATRRERRLGRVVLQYHQRTDLKIARNGGFVIMAGQVQRAFVDEVRELVDAERTAATEQAERIIREANEALGAVGMLFGPDTVRHGFGANMNEGFTSVDQHELTGRPRELLGLVQAAVDAGALLPNPSVKAIGRMFKGFGVPTAIAVRDYLRTDPTRDAGRAA